MKYALTSAILLCMTALCMPCLAWDGFDADTADLVEIIPDAIPDIGSTVDVRNYDKDKNTTCLVESVARNRRTIEVVVRDPEGQSHILVMEGR